MNTQIRNESLDYDKTKILRQSSPFLNKNHREVEISRLVRQFRPSDIDDTDEYWVDLPPEFTKISDFIEPIILRLI